MSRRVFFLWSYGCSQQFARFVVLSFVGHETNRRRRSAGKDMNAIGLFRLLSIGRFLEMDLHMTYLMNLPDLGHSAFLRLRSVVLVPSRLWSGD